MRMYSKAVSIKELHYFTRLNKDFQSDLYWWHIFINSWNGLSFLHLSNPEPPFDTHSVIQTDESGSWGCWALFSTQWFQHRWSAE